MPPRSYPISRSEEDHYKAVGLQPENVSPEILGIGAQSFVRPYTPQGKNLVVKTPLTQLSLEWMTNAYSATIGRVLAADFGQSMRDWKHCAKVFEPHKKKEYLVQPQFYVAADCRRFSVVQERVAMEEITLETITRGNVRDRLQEVFLCNAELLAAHGRWLDAMGFHLGKLTQFALTGTPYLENIVLLPGTDDLRVFDFGLFPKRGLYFRFLLWLQRKNAKKFGLDFAPDIAA